MRNDISPIWGAFVFLALAAVLGGCTSTCETEKNDSLDRNADEASIRAVLEANFAGDPETVTATYTPDGDAWIAGLSRWSPQDRHNAEEEFQGLPGFQGWDGKIESIRFISRDAAIVEVSGTTRLDTGSFDEETTIVVARSEDGWKIAAWRVMNFDETLLNMLRG